MKVYLQNTIAYILIMIKKIVNEKIVFRPGIRLRKIVIGDAISKSKDITAILKEILNKHYSTTEFESKGETDNLIRIHDNATEDQRKYPGRV